MHNFENLLPSLVCENLSDSDRNYLFKVFKLYNNYPSLQQLWHLMDEQWLAYGCDSLQIDERVSDFYRHPVWLLNGLFIEQDPQSLTNRQGFSTWATQKAPARLADFGGGFGGLARLIGEALPQTLVEVVEPNPHPAAIALAAETPNVRFVPELTGVYDLLIATDVFEHVPDPIALTASTASHLRIGGHYMIANCFAPFIHCHLPQLLHLAIGWDQVMAALGMKPKERVLYGRSYERMGGFDVNAAMRVDELSKTVYSLLQPLPRGKIRIGKAIMKIIARRCA
jgi:hypothetical protein